MNNMAAKPESGGTRKKSQSTAERIIDAAEQLFAENGYEGTSLREIAHAVGIREPSIYAHFANKEAIYGAVIDRALAPFAEEMSNWNKADLSLRELYHIPRKLLYLHAQHPYAARILHREFSTPADKISQKIMDWLEQITVQSTQFMDSLPENRHLELNKRKVVTNIITLTNITLGVFSSQGMQARLLGEDYDREALFEEHIRIITKIFKSLLI